MHRLFVAIRPPEPIRDLLIDMMDHGVDLRWVADDNLHLTLRFVGEVERPVATDLADALAQVRAQCFAFQLCGAGTFDRRSGGALWAGIEPREAVTALAAKVERACQSAGLEPEHRAFHPHITLARWSGRRTREVSEVLDRAKSLRSDPFEIDRFTLFESRLSRHGAHYEAVAEYVLS